MVFLGHIILQEHVMEGSSNFMGRSLLWVVSILSIFVAKDTQYWRYNAFSLSRDLERKRDQKFK